MLTALRGPPDLRDVDARAWVYVGRGKPERVRASAMAALATDLTSAGAARLAFKSRGEALDRTDRRVLAKSLPAASAMTYEHLLPHEEPLLWMADALAWSTAPDRAGVPGSKH